VIITTAVILGLPAAARTITRPAGPAYVPDELVGIERPFTDDDRIDIDRELGLVVAGGGGRGTPRR
jgi:hypothetical protein